MINHSKEFWDIVPLELREEIHSIEKLLYFNKGSHIFKEGEKYKGFYIVQQGVIKIFNNLENGRESVHALLMAGEVFAGVPIFQENITYPASAESLTKSECYFYPAGKFKKILQKNTEFMFKFSSLIMQKISYYQKQNTAILSQSLADRIMTFFRELGADKEFIECPVNQNQLAALMGVTPEGFSRELSKLQSQKKLFKFNNLFSFQENFEPQKRSSKK
ncbi:MAG: Crp/Fnr family transcriptional regulator [Spirochaetia bacterium]|nr:Crp/Fnr family transcriptional regulator [Spirochaetia bacterium]